MKLHNHSSFMTNPYGGSLFKINLLFNVFAAQIPAFRPDVVRAPTCETGCVGRWVCFIHMYPASILDSSCELQVSYPHWRLRWPSIMD